MGNNNGVMRALVRHPVATTIELRKLFALSRTLSHATTSSLWPNFRRAQHLRFVRQFSCKEIDDLGMCLEPFFSAYIPHWLSRKEMTKVQELLNPPQYAPLLKNKTMFYQHCRAIGFPIPRCFAVYYKDGHGWTANMRMLNGAQAWEDFLVSCPAEAIVIKPSPGCGGKGLMAYRRKGNMFCDLRGTTYSAAQVLAHIAQSDTEDCMIIQEYLYNHPTIVAISNIDGRQCVRLVTFIDTQGRCHILGAYLKLIVGDNVFDNFNSGTSGNIMADINIDTGILRSAVRVDAHTRGLYTIYKHPDTQNMLLGVQLPHWQATCALACRVASAFLPARAVCWDMIIGPGCPYIIEGNIWWDPTLPNIFGTTRSIVDRMNAEIRE